MTETDNLVSKQTANISCETFSCERRTCGHVMVPELTF